MVLRPPIPTLFPYTTLFRSVGDQSDWAAALTDDHRAYVAVAHQRADGAQTVVRVNGDRRHGQQPDRKSTRLNSSHLVISYAVFCLKKKRMHRTNNTKDTNT